jgi:hypothetical protein
MEAPVLQSSIALRAGNSPYQLGLGLALVLASSVQTPFSAAAV